MSDFKYFFMFQDRDYDEERSGGYMWAPEQCESMAKIEPGDIIFSVIYRNIVSYNIAKGACSFVEKWGSPGWMVAVEYNELKHPISIEDIMDGNLYNERGYLYEIDDKLGSELMNAVIDKHVIRI